MKELCTNRRGYIVRDNLLGTNEPIFHTPALEEFTDIVDYAIKMRDIGQSNEAIVDQIAHSLQQHVDAKKRQKDTDEEGSGPDEDVRIMAERNAVLAPTMMEAIQNGILPDLSQVKNPHAHIKFTWDNNVYGNIFSEVRILLHLFPHKPHKQHFADSADIGPAFFTTCGTKRFQQLFGVVSEVFHVVFNVNHLNW